MGDIIISLPTRSVTGKKPRAFRLYFDTGSPRTFVKESVARNLKEFAKLSKPIIFSGLGDGSFKAISIMSLEIRLLNIWVPHLCYVVKDKVLDPEYDVLLGHDFMQIYDIQVKPKQKDIIVRREALKMALKVR